MLDLLILQRRAAPITPAIFQNKAFAYSALPGFPPFPEQAGRFCEIPVILPGRSSGQQFRNIRVNKTSQRFGKYLLLQLREEYALSTTLVYSGGFPESIRPMIFFKIIDFSSCWVHSRPTRFGSCPPSRIRGASSFVPSGLRKRRHRRNAYVPASPRHTRRIATRAHYYCLTLPPQ